MSERNPSARELDEASQPLPADAPLDAKLSHLRNALERSDLLDASALQNESSSALRFATVFALKSTIGFLGSMGLSSLTLKRLMSILCELDQGYLHPLITPPSIGHRKWDNVSIQKSKATAAAAMHLLMDANVQKDQAASKVARTLRKTAFSKYGGRPISAGMVATWRDRYMGYPSEADAFGAEIFQLVLTGARENCSTPERQAEHVLKAIQQVVKI